MVKMMRRRLGYRKTYRKTYRKSYRKTYKPSYSNGSYKRYNNYSRYKYGRHRISKIPNLQKTFRLQKISNILTTDINVTLAPRSYDVNAGPVCIYNGSYLKANEIEDVNAVYGELRTKLPQSMYNNAYDYLTSDSGINNPNLKLKTTKFTCTSTSTNPVSILSFHDPFISHFAFARDLQSLLRTTSIPMGYYYGLTVFYYDPNANGVSVGLHADLANNLHAAFVNFLTGQFSALYEHWISCIVSNDSKNIFKMIVVYDAANNNFRLVALPIYQLVTNKVELKREIVRSCLTTLGIAGNALETGINDYINNFTATWDALFDTRYDHGYPGIQSACLGLTDNQKRIFIQWVASLLVFGLNNNHTDDFFSYYLDRHKAGELSAECTSSTNAIAGAKMLTIRHLYGDKPNLHDYKPSSNPNVIVISSHLQPVPTRIRQDYKFSSSLALRNIRKALYNNPDMTQFLSEGMRSYIDKAFPELRLYRAGQKAADRNRRLGRH